jgi:hypothetical protein
MSHSVQTKQSVVLDAFLELITNGSPESLPQGWSPICWDVDLLTGAVFIQPGLVSVYSRG